MTGWTSYSAPSLPQKVATNPAFEDAVSQLIDLGKPALVRVLWIILGSVTVPCQNKYGGQAVLENRQLALEKIAQGNPEAFFETVLDPEKFGIDLIQCAMNPFDDGARVGMFLNTSSILWALASIDDPRVHAILIQLLGESPFDYPRFIATHWVTKHRVFKPGDNSPIARRYGLTPWSPPSDGEVQ
jgi:hypothetical protein